QRRRFQEFLRFERCARAFDFREPNGGIRKRAEAQVAPRSQPLARFPDQGELPLESRHILRKRKGIDGASAEHTGRAPPQQLAQLVKFQNLFGASTHASFCSRNSAASAAVAAMCTSLPLASPQGPGSPTSTSRTRSRIGDQNSPSTTIGLPLITDLLSISHTTASSTSVPVPPLQATNPSAARTNSNNRSRPVFHAISLPPQGLALGFKKSPRHPMGLAPALLAPPRTRFHPPAVAAAAHGESRLGQRTPKQTRFLVV